MAATRDPSSPTTRRDDGGFDERVCALDGLFGAGVYFAERSSKSDGGRRAIQHGGTQRPTTSTSTDVNHPPSTSPVLPETSVTGASSLLSERPLLVAQDCGRVRTLS